MRFRVLGDISVERDGDTVALGGPQQRRLLAVLLTERDRVVSTDRLIDSLWPDGESPDAATRSAMKYVSRLRAALGETAIATVGSGYRLQLNGHDYDVDEFEAVADTAGRETPDVAVARYDEVLGLWRGPAFGEFNHEWWARPEAGRLDERRVAVQIARAQSLLAMGHHNRALPDLERLVGEHPLDERPLRLLMQSLQATGRQVEALRAGSGFRRRLVDEVGLDPSADLARLEAAIAAGEPVAEPWSSRPLRGYVLHEPIGEGAHGRVYVATQPGTDRRVAIKVIRPDLADSAEFVLRFEAEARLVARLEHPHVVPLYDYWREPGAAYLVFRLLSGGTARDSVVSGGPWSLSRVTRLIEDIAAALMAAHAAGVAHNDVKASNVLLDDGGAAYLTDFGIAVGLDASGDAAVAADIAGLGRMAWELLAGTRPAQVPPQAGDAADDPGIPSLVGRMPEVPDGLDAVLRRAGDGDYRSVAEFLLAWRAATGILDGRHSPISSDTRRIAARRLTAAAASGVNPYRGLRPFDEADAAIFRGRERVVGDLAESVASRPFVAVVGASGSGKSSVVLAGLVPRLRAGGAVVVTMVPGDAPLDALATVLSEVTTLADAVEADQPGATLNHVARRAGRTVVVVDQFEECWTRAGTDQREAFLAVVSGAVADESVDIRFITTVRADLLDRPLEDPSIGTLVGDGSYVLAPLSPAELADAIVQPAARAGVAFDDGVVADLIAQASSHPGSLPLLQFTLTELYDRRRDAVIDRAALEDIGGMDGAIGRRADEVFRGLDPSRRDDTRSLFGRLVAPGRDGPDTRRRARLSELSEGMRGVADTFVAARLLVADRDPATREPTIEVAHEALLTRWRRLVDWVNEDRRWLDQLQHLATASRTWVAAGRQDGELYRGSRLEAAIEALDLDARATSDLEREFVEAGRHARDAEIRSAKGTARRLRRLLVASAIALVVAMIAGALAVVQRGQADDNAREAEVQAERAEAAAVAAEIEALVGRAESLRQTQRDVAALLAVEAFRLADTPRTRSALFGTFTSDSTFYDAHRLPGTGGAGGIVMADGRSAYLVDDVGRVRPYELDTGVTGDPLPSIGGTVVGSSLLASSADGRWLAHARRAEFAAGPTTVGVIDTRTGTLAFPPFTVSDPVWSAVFSLDARHLALAIGEEARMLIVDASTGRETASTAGVTVPPRSGDVGMEPQSGGVGPTPRPPAVAFSGDELFVGAADGSLRSFNGQSFVLDRTVELTPDTLAALHPLDDGTLVTAGRGGITRVDPATGQVLWQHEEGVSAVGDGASAATCAHLAVLEPRSTFYCANNYGRLAEHDLRSGHVIRVLDAQNGNGGSLWPARDGTELVSFGDNEAVVSRWRLDGSGPITHLAPPGYRGWQFSPNGEHLVVERGGGLGPEPDHVIDVSTGQIVRTLDGLINVDWLDDDTVTGATVDDDGAVETAHIDLPDGPLVADGVVVDPIPNSAHLRPGHERTILVYWSDTGATLRRFDPRSERLGAEIIIDGYVSSAISRSGHRIAAGTERGVELYDGASGELLDVIPGTALRGVFITVADQLFVSSIGGELTLYDLDTLAPTRTFGGSRGFINQLHGTADGRLIATNGGDHTVTLYDVGTGVRIGTPITIPDDHSNWSALAIDGRWLSVGGEADAGSQASRIWSLDPEHWSTAACGVAGRNLTRAEWASHIGDLAPYRATCPAFPTDA